MYNLVSRLVINGRTTDFFLFRISSNYENNEILLNSLITLAELQQECFLYINPFKDIRSYNKDNKEFFIVYHYKTNKIIAWVNVENSIISNTNKRIEKTYTSKIDKIVAISNYAGIKNIGTFLIKYIFDLYKNNEYKFMSLTESYKYKKIDYIYLYSLSIARGFYNRITEFINLSSINKYKEFEHSDKIYFYFPNIITDRKRKIEKINSLMTILHSFEVDEVDVGEIKLLEIPDKCYDTTMISNPDNLEVYDYISTLIKDYSISLIGFDKYIQNRASRSLRTTTRSSIKK